MPVRANSRAGVRAIDHWLLAYLGMQHIPHELTEFELNIFFTFSARECAPIDGRRLYLYCLAVALHLGFVRMTGHTLDSYKQIAKRLQQHPGAQLSIDPLEFATTVKALATDSTLVHDTLVERLVELVRAKQPELRESAAHDLRPWRARTVCRRCLRLNG